MVSVRGKAKPARAPKPPKALTTRPDGGRPRRRFALPPLRRAPPAPSQETVLLAGYRRPPPARRNVVLFYLVLAAACLGWGYMFGVAAPYKIMPLLAPLPVLMLLLVWCLPQGEYAPAKALEPLYLGFFAAFLIWPNYLAITIPHLPWLTMLRIFAAPLALVLLVCLSVSAVFRKNLKDVITSDRYIWKMALGFIILQTVSIIFSDRPTQSINKYIVSQLNHSIILIVSCYLFTRKDFASRWVGTYLAGAYIVCFVGLWQYMLGQLPWVGHIPPLLKVDSNLIENLLRGVARSAVGVNRVQSVATSPLGLAELLGLAAPFALHLAVTPGKILHRALGLIYLPLALYVILLSDSRLGVVALFGALLLYLLIWSALRWTSDRRSIVGPALVLAYPAVLIVTLMASFVVGALRNAMWGGGAEASSTTSRFIQWQMAWPKILSHPWGYGIGEASKEVGFRGPTGQGTLDSYYILLLMDYGILGFVLYMGMFLRAAWLAGRTTVRYRPTGELLLLFPLCVALMNFVVIKLVFALEANHPLVFMMLGATVALLWRVKQQEAAAGGAPGLAPAQPRAR